MSSLDLLAEEIAAHCPGPVFGVPGSGATLTLLDKLEQRGHEFVLTHFEGTAAIMAGTLGRLSGKAGACLSIKGPGVTNMVPGLAVSAFESFPLVAVVEAYGPDAALAKAHKRIDQAALTSTVSKGITQLTAGGPGFAEVAGFASAETPGPVILELAQPEPDTPTPLPTELQTLNGINKDAVIDLVEKAKRPIVVAGALALRQELGHLLNALKVPVFSTAAAKGAIDETLSHSAGVYTGVGLELSPEHSLFKEADLVVCIGLRPSEVLATRPFGLPAVNITATQEAGSEAFEFDAIAGLEDTGDVVAILNGKSWGEDQVSSAQDQLHRALLSNTFLPAHVYEQARTHFDGNVCGVFDTGYFCTIAEHIWVAANASQCLMSGQGRYMGAGVAMALAAAIHDPSVPTVAFLGDGSIGPFIGEAKIAVERKLPLLFCLLTDGRFASIRTRSLQDGLTEKPLTPALPSWLSIMDGFGMPVYSASDERSVADALSSWTPSDGPAYLEVSFEPDSYEAMVKGIR